MNPNTLTASGAQGPQVAILSTFTIFDIIGSAVSALGLLWARVASAGIQPVFAKMFADYQQPVPGFTALCLKPWFPFALALVPFLVIAAGIIRRARLNVRAVLMACAITLTIVIFPAVFIFGMYLPIFSLAPVR